MRGFPTGFSLSYQEQRIEGDFKFSIFLLFQFQKKQPNLSPCIGDSCSIHPNSRGIGPQGLTPKPSRGLSLTCNPSRGPSPTEGLQRGLSPTASTTEHGAIVSPPGLPAGRETLRGSHLPPPESDAPYGGSRLFPGCAEIYPMVTIPGSEWGQGHKRKH
jgi:hypothetical protein